MCGSLVLMKDDCGTSTKLAPAALTVSRIVAFKPEYIAGLTPVNVNFRASPPFFTHWLTIFVRTHGLSAVAFAQARHCSGLLEHTANLPSSPGPNFLS